MEKKVKITLFDLEGRITDEKWVSQTSEFYKGPLGRNTGPFRIEFTFMDQTDVEKVIKYIQQLTGILPIEAKEKKLKKVPLEPQQREELIEEVLKESMDQDQLIKSLRDRQFVFVTWEYLQTLEHAEIIEMKEFHGSKYQWMVKRIKFAKNPKFDKYDLMVLFGISLLGERSEKVPIYLNGQFLKKVVIPIPEKPRETVKKTEMMKFPAAMIEEEREKFRFELRALQKNPEKEITKFFKRWRPFIENVPAIPQDKKVQE